MTLIKADDLKSLVIKGDTQAMCDALAKLTEAERKTLSGYAATLCYWVDKYWSPGKKSDSIPAEEPDHDAIVNLMKALKATKYDDWRRPRWTAQLMAVALCDQRFIESPEPYCGWLRTDLKDMPQWLLQVLAARRPAWLAKWLEKEWRQEFPVPNWYVERGLIRCGALPKNDSPEYYVRMAAVFPTISYHTQGEADEFADLYDDTECASFRSIKEMLAADPELLTHDIWRLFDVDSDAFRYRLKEWGTALVEFSQEGKLDRQRLLLRSLEGMGLPLSPTTLTGFGKFHEMLDPTLDERESLVELYLGLLSSNNSTVVGSALSALEKLQKAKRLDVDLYLDAMPNAFLVDKKSQPVSAIKLAVKLMKQSPKCKTKAVKAIIPAIRHSNADVQVEALTVLEANHDLIDQESTDELASMTNGVAVAVRPQLAKLLQSCGTRQSSTSSVKDATKAEAKSKSKPPSKSEVKPKAASSDSKSLDNKLLKQVAALPDTLRQQSRLEDAMAALRNSSTPTVFPLEKHVAPRRDPASKIHPVKSLDELIALVSSVIEGIKDIVDLERVLDGIYRFHSEKPKDFDSRVAALRQRIASRAMNHNQEVLYYSIDIGFPQLLMTWLELPPMVRQHSIHWHTMRGWFLRERIDSLRNRIADSRNPHSRKPKSPMPMLAMPTHKGGWIDPVVLVSRLNDSYSKEHELPCNFDLAQAILRLTPDGRSEALAMLDEADHYNGGVALRYALGDKCELSNNGGWGVEEVMVAAERARAISLASDNYQPRLPIAKARLDEQQHVAITGAILEDPTVPFTLTETAFSVEPTPTGVFDPNLLDHLWIRSWEAMTNPIDTEASCLAGHMAHLFDREATWSSEVCRLFLLASSNDRSETRISATDAMIEAVDRVLVIPDRLGEAMAHCQNHLKLNRVLKALHDAAQASSLHHWVVLQSLARYIELTSELPSDVHLILAQMLESAMTIGAEVKSNVSDRLAPLGNKSKAGKLASQLLQLRQTSNFQQTINEAILMKTLERAQRWNSIACK